MRILQHIEHWSRATAFATGSAIIALVGVLDFITGAEVAFSAFYVLPVAMVAWVSGQLAGLAAALVSAVVWLAADYAAGHQHSHPLVPIWNTLIRLSLFVIIAWLVSQLREAIERERTLARVDSLTGAANSRFFLVTLDAEVERSRRYRRPFTLAYVDLDDFKAVNDRYGHAEGDRALRAVAAYLRAHLRTVDVLARLGGDEFAVLLPETAMDVAGKVLEKLREGVLGEMRSNGWPITVSMGAISCAAPQCSGEDLLRQADSLMYAAKRAGKHTARYAEMSSQLPAA